MSELDWKWAYFPWLDAPEKQHESAVNAGYVKVVLKSEADKVIAELNRKIKLYEDLGSCNKGCPALRHNQRRVQSEIYKVELKEKEIRHHKYKRCWDMSQEWRNYAAFCGMQSSCHNHRGFGKTAEKWSWRETHAWRCVNRWIKLAMKFELKNGVNNA